MSYKKSDKKRQQRWVLIRGAIDLGVWEDEDDFRNWLYAEFGTTKTSKLSEAQTKTLYIYLKYYNGMSGEPKFGASQPWRVSNKQIWLIEELKQVLEWSDDNLVEFIQRQLGVITFPRALSKVAANKVITGMEKIRSWKQKETAK